MGKPIGWIQGNINIPVYTIVALTVYYLPGDILFRSLENVRFILIPIFTLIEAISKCETIANVGVDGVLLHKGSEVFERSIFAALVIGTISGCGGGILGSMINVRESDWRFSTPSQFKNPNTSMILSFFCSIIYLLLHRGMAIKKAVLDTPMALILDLFVKNFAGALKRIWKDYSIKQ